MSWKNLKDRPIDDKNYLVSWLQADGTYSSPHRAYFVEEEGKFFTLEGYHSFPLIVDIYCEIPEVPRFK